ncbi:MAG TPA: hypothetical protein VGU64_02410, partial [Terriglobales bacterium]|nr:hypothetical protein [Terriglobales bacterium]
ANSVRLEPFTAKRRIEVPKQVPSNADHGKVSSDATCAASMSGREMPATITYLNCDSQSREL